MSDIVFEAVNLIVMICAALVSAYIIPYMRSTIGDRKIQEIADWAERAVLFAQQTMSAKPGAERKAYVVDFLTEIATANKVPITVTQIDILVESAVKQLRIDEAKGQTVKITADLKGDDSK